MKFWASFCTAAAWAGLLVPGWARGSAQGGQVTAKDPGALTGTITGDVYDAGSNLPVRFAEIRLVPRPEELGGMPAPEVASPQEGTTGRKERLSIVSGNSGIDGGVQMGDVPVGDYLVVASKPGYVTSGMAMADNRNATDAQMIKAIEALTSVHVGAGQAATVHLALRRGAVITGRVQYADGGPAIGLPVSAESLVPNMPSPENGSRPISSLQSLLMQVTGWGEKRADNLTDDEGRYRIFGLGPGKYVVSILFTPDHITAIGLEHGSAYQPQGRQQIYPEMVMVYGPGVFRRAAAKVFEIRADEQVTGADLTIDPEGLHTLSGRVLAQSDRHVPSGAMVRLREVGAVDPGRFVGIEEDGSFCFHEVPSAAYRMQIMTTDQPPPNAQGAVSITHFKTLTMPVTVEEKDVVLNDVLVTALKAGEVEENVPF